MQHPSNTKTGIEKWLGLAALVMLALLCYFVIRPFAQALMWALVLSFVLYPVQRKFVKWFCGKHGWAALTVTLLAVLLVVAPITLIGLSLVDDGKKLAVEAKEQVLNAPEEAPAWLSGIPFLGNDLSAYWHDFIVNRREWTNREKAQKAAEEENEDTNEAVEGEAATGDKESGLNTMLDEGVDSLRKFVMWMGMVLGKGVVQITISLFLVFFILRDAEKLGSRLKVAVSRIAGERGRRLMNVAGQTVKGVVYGYLGTSTAQAILAGIGFLIAGIPGAVLLGTLTFFLAVIPVGPPLIWGGASVWLFMQGKTGWTVFMVIWGFFAISSVDNVLRPFLVSQGNKMPFALMFLGMIGGAVAFGLIGVFLGPTLLAVAFRLVDEWTGARQQAQLENGKE
ncbi:AI-2E family transporter [Luteolibacter algae]|uniref:AI-2E family transporter n=1 Tax=Luteolibacter algae TaxID=454151 RepID=A0ABW5D7T7_9BACT